MPLSNGGRSNELCFNHDMANDRRDRDPTACDRPDGEKIFSGPFSLGAKHSMPMDAELDRFAIVTVYPSREVRDDAVAHISALRSEGAEEFGAELMDAYGGEMLASSKA